MIEDLWGRKHKLVFVASDVQEGKIKDSAILYCIYVVKTYGSPLKKYRKASDDLFILARGLLFDYLLVIICMVLMHVLQK